MRTPAAKARPDGISREDAEASYRDTLLKTLAIEHTVDTKVGNENVRGVSGGERKVSERTAFRFRVELLLTHTSTTACHPRRGPCQSRPGLRI